MTCKAIMDAGAGFQISHQGGRHALCRLPIKADVGKRLGLDLDVGRAEERINSLCQGKSSATH
jgi:hypothetical protein